MINECDYRKNSFLFQQQMQPIVTYSLFCFFCWEVKTPPMLNVAPEMLNRSKG